MNRRVAFGALTSVTTLLVACTLLVDTEGLSGGTLGDASLEAAADVVGDALPTDAGAPPACERFDGLKRGAYWATRGGCLTRAGRTSLLGPPTPHLAWQFAADAATYSAPTLDDDGTIYFGTERNDNSTFAVRPSGTLKWMRVKGNVSNAVTIGADGTLYASTGTPEAGVQALAGDGAPRWRAPAPDESDTSPAVGSDGTVYYGSYAVTVDGGGWALAAYPDGGARWSLHLDGEGGTPAVGADGTLYMVGGRRLYAVTPEGAVKWATDLPVACGSPTLAADGTIYLHCADGALRAFSPGGAPGFSYRTNGVDINGPAIAADGTIYAGASDEALHAIHPDGTRAWIYEAQTALGTPLVSGDGTIYVGGADGTVHAVNPDGTRRWVFTVGGMIDSQPAIAPGGVLYVMSRSGALSALAP